jgi:hypothetical protein
MLIKESQLKATYSKWFKVRESGVFVWWWSFVQVKMKRLRLRLRLGFLASSPAVYLSFEHTALLLVRRSCSQLES